MSVFFGIKGFLKTAGALLASLAAAACVWVLHFFRLPRGRRKRLVSVFGVLPGGNKGGALPGGFVPDNGGKRGVLSRCGRERGGACEKALRQIRRKDSVFGRSGRDGVPLLLFSEAAGGDLALRKKGESAYRGARGQRRPGDARHFRRILILRLYLRRRKIFFARRV